MLPNHSAPAHVSRVVRADWSCPAPWKGATLWRQLQMHRMLSSDLHAITLPVNVIPLELQYHTACKVGKSGKATVANRPLEAYTRLSDSMSTTGHVANRRSDDINGQSRLARGGSP